MKNSPVKNKLLTPGILIIMLLLNLICRSQEINLVAVGNKAGVPSLLTLSELRSILKGENQKWQNGTKIVIALMKTNTAIGQATSFKIYNMSEYQLNRYWIGLVMQGKAEAPNFFNTVAELRSFVIQNAGAIGVIDKQSAEAAGIRYEIVYKGGTTQIKSVMIDGRETF